MRRRKNGRYLEVRIAKDAPVDGDQVVDPPNPSFSIDEDAAVRVINHAVKAYATIKGINLACDMAQHILVRTLP